MATGTILLLIGVITTLVPGLMVVANQETSWSISSNRTPFILNGSDLNMNCTLNQTKTKNASDIIWTACSNSLESIPIAEQYSVELIDGRTSSIRIKNLPMRGNAIYFQCVLQDSGQCDDFDHLVEVYVALLPAPARDLECFSHDALKVTCTWRDGGGNSIRVRKNYFQYRDRFAAEDWKTLERAWDNNRATINASIFEMQIRVIQENVLGNCSSPSSTRFSIPKHTIPNVPKNILVDFTLGESDVISMRVQWAIPEGWKKAHVYLEYRINYTAEGSNQDTVVEVNNTSYTVSNLWPYSNYTVMVASKLQSADNWSEWSPGVTNLSPEIAPSGPVLHLNSSMKTGKTALYKRDIVLTWKAPSPERRNGLIRGYLVESKQIGNVTVYQPQYVIPGLDNFKSYDVRVAAFTKEGAVGPYSSLIVGDLTEVPDPVENFRSVEPTPTSIQLMWDTPSNPKGVVKTYFIEWTDSKNSRNVYIYGLATNYSIGELQPYTKYTISISVQNSAGTSTTVSQQVQTDFAEPTQPQELVVRRFSPTKITIDWEKPEVFDGPMSWYNIRYRPLTEPSGSSINKSVSDSSITLTINCSAFDEAVPFVFEIFSMIGSGGKEKMVRTPVKIEEEMCGGAMPYTTIMIIILIVAFSLVLLILCLCYSIRNSSIMKPVPDPFFINGILELSNDKFKPNGRLSSRRQEKEDYDVLRTSEFTNELIGKGQGIVSMGSSSGSSSDQGFHEMNGEMENMSLEVGSGVSVNRYSSGYCQSDSDLQQQRMLSMQETDEVDSVFNHPEDDDDDDSVSQTQVVTSYRITLPPSEATSPEPVQRRVGSLESVQYTSRRVSPVIARRTPSTGPSTPEQQRSGSQSGYMSYVQVGALIQQFPPAGLRRQDTGEESDTAYSQMGMQMPIPTSPPPPYASVWPSDTSPETIEPTTIIDMGKEEMDGLHGELGFNNNSKEIPDIHGNNNFRPQANDIIVATAFSSPAPAGSLMPSVRSPLPRLSSSGSDNYIDVIGGNISPRANPSTPGSPTVISSPLPVSCGNSDTSCQDYVMQCQLPPPSPMETSIV
ncbi:uncharacterized protein LOC117297492 [Asterias rubens]|uniref:uncharacterized protein LOC117297492 n=1 Tax=Asterias rubens TaxID=7604 RepID=UPI001455C9F3|nr:uncharacterized protein LOC117297492 [Asterias rubens]